MRCSQCKKFILDYIDGNLPDSKHQKIRHHLSGCESCRREYNELKTMLEFDRNTSKSLEPDPCLDREIIREARRRNPCEKKTKSPFSRLLKPIPATLAASVLVVVISIAYLNRYSNLSHSDMLNFAPQKEITETSQEIDEAHQEIIESAADELADAIAPPAEPFSTEEDHPRSTMRKKGVIGKNELQQESIQKLNQIEGTSSIDSQKKLKSDDMKWTEDKTDIPEVQFDVFAGALPDNRDRQEEEMEGMSFGREKSPAAKPSSSSGIDVTRMYDNSLDLKTREFGDIHIKFIRILTDEMDVPCDDKIEISKRFADYNQIKLNALKPLPKNIFTLIIRLNTEGKIIADYDRKIDDKWISKFIRFVENNPFKPILCKDKPIERTVIVEISAK